MTNNGISVQDLNKRFGSFHAVQDVSFEAMDGKITAILGPSGSGKSTVLRMIAGLEIPDSGRVTLADEEQTFATVQERRVGFVFQHYALFRHMTVRDNVAFGLSIRKEPKADIRRRVDDLLELVQLAPLADRYPDQLSGGSGSGSRSLGRSRRDRRSCCSTSPSARSMLASARSSVDGWTTCTVSST